MERYSLLTERSHLSAPDIHICFAVELAERYSDDDIREATRKVMIKHPILRSYVRIDRENHAWYEIDEVVRVDFSSIVEDEHADWIAVVRREQEKPFV